MKNLTKKLVKTRRRRAFVPSDAGGMRGMRLEPRALAAPLFWRAGGTNEATADYNSQPNQVNSFNINFDPNNPSASGSSQYAVPQGQGSGTASTSDIASANVGGTGGASGIAVNGQVSGTIDGDLSAGILPFAGPGATVASTDANGNPAPLTWTVGDSNPNETSGYVTVTFQVTGTDGINSSTNVGVTGAFSLGIVAGDIMILMNTESTTGQGGNGLRIYENPSPSNPMGWTQVYQDNNSDDSPDGIIDYVPPIPGMPGTGRHPQGSASFSGSFSATFPIATTGGAGFSIAYAAGFNEDVNGGQGLFTPGDHVQATPSMQWTFSVTDS
jgi:hypothetical protein